MTTPTDCTCTPHTQGELWRRRFVTLTRNGHYDRATGEHVVEFRVGGDESDLLPHILDRMYDKLSLDDETRRCPSCEKVVTRLWEHCEEYGCADCVIRTLEMENAELRKRDGLPAGRVAADGERGTAPDPASVFVVIEDVQYEEPSEIRGVFATEAQAREFMGDDAHRFRKEEWEFGPADREAGGQKNGLDRYREMGNIAPTPPTPAIEDVSDA